MFKISDKILYSLVALGGCAMLVALWFFDPSTSGVFPSCPTNALTHLHCPGCGTLRAMHALLHGHLGEAFSQNALAVIFLPILPIMFFFPKPFQRPLMPIALLILFIGFAILRNIAYFSFLAPH